MTWASDDAELVMDVAEADYHAGTGHGPGLCISRSMIKTFIRSKDLYRLRYIDSHPIAQLPQNDGMRMGTLVEAIAEGTDAYEITTEHATPSGNMSTKPAAKAWLADCTARGVVGCTEKQFMEATFYWDRLQEQHPTAAALMANATHRQAVIHWTDKETGLRLHVRLDWCVSGRCLGDLKTGTDSPERFLSVAEKYGYVYQDPMYTAAWEMATGEVNLPFLFAYQQTSEPWASGLFQFPNIIRDSADDRIRAALRGIAAGEFSSAHTGVTIVEPEFWWLAQHETETGGES